MKLNILNVAYPFAPVGPDAVGGAEQVLTLLDAAIADAGHGAFLAACDGSTSRGRHVARVPVVNSWLPDRQPAVRAAYAEAIRRALCEWPIDVVHMHGLDCLTYLPPPGVPVLATLHLPPSWYPPAIWSLPRADFRLNCVSYSQRAQCASAAREPLVIENGVPLPAPLPAARRRSFALCLGRVCPEKGFHLALDAARRARVPLLLAGRVFPYPEHEAYFASELAPRLGPHARFVGPVGLAGKRRLLAAARCLLVPSLAPETSSLVAMEALACGTPVVAFNVGALPEIIRHGETGLLVQDVAEMAEALQRVTALSPAACRAAAEARFDGRRMCAAYLRLYESLVRERQARAASAKGAAAC